MASNHHRAKKTLQPYLLGNIEEISRKVPWGFYRSWELKNLAVSDYLAAPSRFCTTRILHVLLGEGESLANVIEVLKKAARESTRVLILEHNPQSSDWSDAPYVQQANLAALEKYLETNKFCYKKLPVGWGNNPRNLLYVVSTIPHFDYCDVTSSFLIKHKDGLAPRFGWPGAYDANEKVLALTSENRYNFEKLLSPELIDICHRQAVAYYSVIGGLMFLDALAQVSPSQIVLFDGNFLQCVYAAFVINAINECRTLQDFDAFLSDPARALSVEKISSFDALWRYDELRLAICESKIQDRHWRNLLYIGRWRSQYALVRERLDGALAKIITCNLRHLQVPRNAVVYTSTIKRSTVRRFIKRNGHKPIVFSCLTKRRDEPALWPRILSESKSHDI